MIKTISMVVTTAYCRMNILALDLFVFVSSTLPALSYDLLESAIVKATNLIERGEENHAASDSPFADKTLLVPWPELLTRRLTLHFILDN
jgi:hypothetical protein